MSGQTDETGIYQTRIIPDVSWTVPVIPMLAPNATFLEMQEILRGLILCSLGVPRQF